MQKKTKTDQEDGIDRGKQRLDLIKDIPEERFQAISKVAWHEARVANAILKRGEWRKPGEKTETWERLGTRTKQKAVMDFYAGILTSEEFRTAMVKEAIARPIDAMKIYVSTIPKDVEVNVNQNQMAVIVLPGKAGGVAQWMDMVNGSKAIDGEVVGEAGASAAETWKNILEKK